MLEKVKMIRLPRMNPEYWLSIAEEMEMTKKKNPDDVHRMQLWPMMKVN